MMRSEVARSEYEKKVFDEIVRAKIKDMLDIYEGVNLSSLSRATGLPVSTLSRVLSGDRKMTTFVIYKVCTALNVPLSTFFVDIDERMEACLLGTER